MLVPAFVCLALAARPAPPGQEEAAAAPARGFELPDAEALGTRLDELAAAHPGKVETLALGRTRGGRAIRGLRVSSGTAAAGRPAILLVANVDGPRVFDTALALRVVERLLEGAASGEGPAHELLASTTLYVVPSANPDGAAARFERPLRERRATGSGVDSDRDGREGEDDAADLDGDGRVLSMRVPDPEGRWIADPTDGRALREAKGERGERGTWKLFPEGRDDDGDEQVAEDPPLDAEVNANFASGWQEHAPRAGRFPSDEPAARALSELVLARPDIALVVTYGDLDDVSEAPKPVAREAARRRDPAPGFLEGDAQLVGELGRRYREIAERAVAGSGDDAGSFQRWVYDHRGLWPVNVVPWDVPVDAKARPEDGGGEDAETGNDPDDAPDAGEPAPEGAPDEAAPEDAAPEEPATGERRGRGAKGKGEKDEDKPSDDALRLRWIDSHPEESWRFVPWAPFEHPELGAVEIGGLAPYARLEPPAAEHERLADEQLAFLSVLARSLARVEVVECTARELGGELVEVRAAIENPALLPVLSAAARRARTARPVRVALSLPEGAELLAGPRQELLSELAGSGGRAELRWLVRGAAAGAITLVVDSDHAGHHEVQPSAEGAGDGR